MMSGNDCLNKKRSNRRQKVDSELAATTSVGSVLQMCGAASAKARLPTVDSLTGGSTTRRLALVERSVRRPGKSSTRLLSLLFLLLLAITVLLTLTTFNSTTTLLQVTIEH